jgi:hypothetical protein
VTRIKKVGGVLGITLLRGSKALEMLLRTPYYGTDFCTETYG